ncbi:MAG TPA: GvpL/GvpF family gas vesicle protein, partial [Longimicrobiales bacterium]
MGVYGYCVMPRDHEPDCAVRGIGGAVVHTRPIAKVLVWVSELDRPEATIEHVRAHNAVIERGLTETVTPVPLRFGQWAEAAAVLESAISEKADWYAERLRAFAGAMEFGLRIVRADAGAPARVVRVPRAESGTAYMEALRARTAAARSQREAAEHIRAHVDEAMRAIVREQRVDDPSTPHGVVTISHLVARECFEEYRGAVQAL